MFDFIAGKNYSSSFLYRTHRLRMMETSGRTLASLHRHLIGFQPDGMHHLGFKGLDQERLRNVSWNTRKINELVKLSKNISEPEDKKHVEWLVGKSNEILQNLGHLDQKLEGANLPRFIIHGDYGLHNLIYTDADHAVPVDFELARIEWRMSELVSVISKFRYKDGTYDFESIVRFMQAYQKEFPIFDHEWDVFPLVWKYYKLMKSIQYWISYFETNGPVRKLRSSRDEIEFSNWALENPDQIAEFRELKP
jgi:Ser/Thr protein kinase RdoA (MazF antagonist)